MTDAGTSRRGAVRFPFTAIVGHEQMKLALLLNAINPAVGGVLIRGNKGTAKSTAVRSLADVLPPITAVAGCRFNCEPGAEAADCPAGHEDHTAQAETRPVRIVDLPISASEDRLVGALDVEQALQSGQRAFESGLLAAAHRGILYIDEVNLLNDHLVDLLLDAAAMGWNYVEREGLSFSHPARFILVGTMNPEEGELRPQLLDRFGLMVEAGDGMPPADRVEVVRRRIAFDADPEGFRAAWADAEEALRQQVIAARALLPHVVVPDAMLEAIATLCAACEVDGLRADIVIYRAAATLAAYAGRTEVTLEDVRAAAKLALVHRQRRQPFQQPSLDEERIDQALQPFDTGDDGNDEGDDKGDEPAGDDGPNPPDDPPDGGDDGDGDRGDGPDSAPDRKPEPPAPGAGREDRADIGDPQDVRAPKMARRDERERTALGRRLETRSDANRGRHTGSRMPRGRVTDIDIPATLRAAAPYQHHRRHGRPDARVVIARTDLREKVREGLAATLIVFVVDASGSMGAQRRMEATKGAILSLLTDAYQRRDRVAMVAFRGAAADVVLPPTGSVDLAHRALTGFVTGGRTPLAAGLNRAWEVVSAAARREPGLVPLLVLISDGRANAAPDGADPLDAATLAAGRLRALGARGMVIDTETGPVRLGLAREMADALGGEYVRLDGEVSAEALERVVRHERSAQLAVPVGAR